MRLTTLDHKLCKGLGSHAVCVRGFAEVILVPMFVPVGGADIGGVRVVRRAHGAASGEARAQSELKSAREHGHFVSGKRKAKEMNKKSKTRK